MKRSFALISALLTLLSCSKVTLDLPGDSPDSPVVFNLDVKHPAGTGPGTKAVRLAWSEEDVVFVFFEDDPVNYVKMTWTDSGWSYEQKPGKVRLESGKRLTAVHLPFNTDDPVYDGGWKFQQHFAYYFCAEAVPYTLETDPLTGTRSVNVSVVLRTPDAIIQFLIPDKNPVDGKYTLMEASLTPTACGTITPGGSIGRTILHPGDPMPALTVQGDGYYFYGILDPSRRGTPHDYHFSLVELDPDTGSTVSTATQSFYNKTLYFEENGLVWNIGVKFSSTFGAL